MSEWLSGDAIANGIRTHYYRTGGNKPPVVLSHGFGDDGLCWTRLARALEADYDVVMPDARGHGHSEAPEGPYTSEARAADLAGLIQALGLDRPAIGGHSMGAQTSLFCAGLYPDLVRCAILEDPAIRLEGQQASQAELEAHVAQARESARSAKAATREQLIAHCRKQSPTWDEVELGPWADSKRQLSLNAIGVLSAAERLAWREPLAKITCPILLVTADPDKGSIVTPEAAAEAVRILPSLKVVRLSGAGHNIRREQFEGFVQAVRAFLASVS